MTLQRTSFCARCLLLAADEGVEAADIDATEEAPPCELLSIIGDSPRATTFLGEQTWPVRRLVALKLFKQQSQARAPGRVGNVPRHPNIAPLLESGRLGERRYAMTEYFGGGVLPRCYDRHRLGAVARADALLAIADAIGIAHKNGVSHGRVTASNLVCDSRPPYPVRVVDFCATTAPGAMETEFDRLTRADLEGIVAVAQILFQSPFAGLPSTVDLSAELRRLRLSAQWAPDLRHALAALASKLVV